MALNLNPEAIRRADSASQFEAGTNRAREAESVYAEFLPALEPRPDHNDEQRTYLDERREQWRVLVTKAYNEMISRRAAWVPVTVAGPARYPSEKMAKRADADLRCMREWSEKIARFKGNTAKRLQQMESLETSLERYAHGGGDPVSGDDPHAVEKLTAKLDGMQTRHERMKGINAHYRKHGTCIGFEGLSLSDAERLDADVDRAYVSKKQPFPGYSLSNSNAQISRLRTRLEQLKKRKITAEAGTLHAGTGFRIEANGDMGRVQIFFDEKPGDALRTLLKSRGFRWAPSVKAWQRMLNDNGLRAAKKVAEEIAAMG